MAASKAMLHECPGMRMLAIIGWPSFEDQGHHGNGTNRRMLDSIPSSESEISDMVAAESRQLTCQDDIGVVGPIDQALYGVSQSPSAARNGLIRLHSLLDVSAAAVAVSTAYATCKKFAMFIFEF